MSQIWRGCSYYPPHHDPADWERDFERMAAAGFNALRTAELLASWDQMERTPRQPDFSWLDHTFDLAARFGIRILLGTGACCPPIWMRDAYPDIQILTRNGVSHPTGAAWHWACIDHPAYRVESDRYLQQLLARYAYNPTLLGWQIDNEPGHPFLGREGGIPDWYCYCAHSEARFRDWLQEKYGTIDALNVAWRWNATHHQYRNWAQIRAPRATPAEGGVMGAWMDWRAFWADNWAAFLAHQTALIKVCDPQHPVATNLLDAADFNNRMGTNPWAIARVVDAIGYDLYPGLRQHAVPQRARDAGGPSYASWFLDLGRSTAQAAGKDFWVTEMESGPLDWWVKGPRYATTALDIKRWYLQAIGHGARMVMYQGYREWNCIPIHWGALVDLDGQPTDRYYAAACVNAVVRQHEAALAVASPVPAQIGILFGHDNVVLTASLAADDFNRRALTGLYEALWMTNHPVDMLNGRADRFPYRVMFLPFAMRIGAETAHRLRNYVETGGIIVGFAKSAIIDDHGRHWSTRPGGGLAEVFGVRERRLEHRPEAFTIKVALNGRTVMLPGFHHQQVLEIAPGTEIFGWFDDGSPAATRRAYGKGWAIYFATHFDISAFGNPVHHDFFGWFVDTLDVKRPAIVRTSGRALVDPHVLVGPGGEQVLILANEGIAPADVVVITPELCGRTAEELFGLPVEMTQKDPPAVRLRIPAMDAALVRIWP
jgi:beta-galactosidase